MRWQNGIYSGIRVRKISYLLLGFNTLLYFCILTKNAIIHMVRFIDLFAGIGGIRIPFDELGYQCVFSSEWDKAACVTYAANFGEHPQGDITKIPEKDIPPHDLLLAGFPCQEFSIMGKMQGFADTRGTMFFEIERILAYHKRYWQGGFCEACYLNPCLV